MFELQGSPILNKKDYHVMYDNKHKYHIKLFLNEFYRLKNVFLHPIYCIFFKTIFFPRQQKSLLFYVSN